MVIRLASLLILIVATLVLPVAADDAKEQEPDFRHWGRGVTINRFTDTTGERIAAIENREDLTISVKGAVAPAQLATICSWPWVEKLTITGDADVVSLEPISKLTKLRELRLLRFESAKKAPLDATPLGALRELEVLSLSSTPLKNMEALKHCSKMKRLDLHMARADTLDFVRSMPDLEYLNLYGFEHKFENYEPVATLKKLEFLNVYMNRQATDENLKVLEALTSLTTFQMANCRKVTTIDFLKNCKDLERIEATWAKALTDIDVIAELPNLEKLDFADVPVEDLTPFQGHKKLRDLSLRGSKIKDVTPLAGCEGMEYLRINETEVSDISPLAKLTNLRTLAISNTPVKDLSPLHKLPKLSAVTLSSSVPKDQVEALKKAQPKVRIQVRD